MTRTNHDFTSLTLALYALADDIRQSFGRDTAEPLDKAAEYLEIGNYIDAYCALSGGAKYLPGLYAKEWQTLEDKLEAFGEAA